MQTVVEIKKMLEDIINMCGDKQGKCNLLDSIVGIEPYSAHTQMLEELKEEILGNE